VRPSRYVTRVCVKRLLWKLLAIFAAVFVGLFGQRTWISAEKRQAGARGPDLVLVTSFWAADLRNSTTTSTPIKKENPHRREIENAFVLNIGNSLFDEVRIVLEGHHHSYNCTTLRELLEEKLSLVHASTQTRFVCVEHDGPQPSYFEMFNYTTDIALNGSVIILANADMAFDQTVLQLKDLNAHTAGTISTQGFGKGRWPPQSIQRQLKRLGMEPTKMRISNRCYARARRSSWDAYVFHFNSLNFNSSGFRDEVSGEKFTMNTMGAENAALYYLKHASPNITFNQICDHVDMWHIHASPKMHSSERWVSSPRALASECADIAECLGN